MHEDHPLVLPTITTLLLSFIAQLAAIPEFAKLGPLFRSSPKPTELTESETEYVVNCIKHVYNDHVVFQVCGNMYYWASCGI